MRWLSIMSMRIHSTHIRVHAAVRAWRTFQFNVYFSDTSRSRNSPLIDESIWLMRTVICHQRCNTTVVRVNVVAQHSPVTCLLLFSRYVGLLGLQIKRLYACTVSRMFPHFFQYNSVKKSATADIINFFGVYESWENFALAKYRPVGVHLFTSTAYIKCIHQ